MAIVKSGGKAYYDYEFENGRRVKALKPRGPDWLRKLLGEDFFNDVEYVIFYRPDLVTDAGLENLRGEWHCRLSGLKLRHLAREQFGAGLIARLHQ